MTTKQILRDSASYTLRASAPDGVDISDGCTISITTPGGVVLVDADDMVTRAADTLSTAATAGRKTFVITAGVGSYTPTSGDHFRVGSASQGWQYLTVVSYASATKTVTADKYARQSFASGSAVQYLDMTYELDTTAAAWDGIDRVTVEYIPQTSTGVDPDQIPWTEIHEVLLRSSTAGVVDSDFRDAFPMYWESVPDGSIDVLRTRATQRLKTYFESKGRDWSRVVDSEILHEPLLIQMAVLTGLANSERFKDELEWLTKDLQGQLSAIDSLSIWVDFDEDKIEDDAETAPAEQPGLSRGL
jgi:hypothetical protein